MFYLGSLLRAGVGLASEGVYFHDWNYASVRDKPPTCGAHCTYGTIAWQ